MLDEGVIYVAGHPPLNRRCTRLPGCFYFPNCNCSWSSCSHPADL